MYLSLSVENLDRIIEALEKIYMSRKDAYLIEYLKTIKKNHVTAQAAQKVDYDVIPF